MATTKHSNRLSTCVGKIYFKQNLFIICVVHFIFGFVSLLPPCGSNKKASTNQESISSIHLTSYQVASYKTLVGKPFLVNKTTTLVERRFAGNIFLTNYPNLP